MALCDDVTLEVNHRASETCAKEEKENDLVKEDENNGVNTQKILSFYKSQDSGFTRMEGQN